MLCCSSNVRLLSFPCLLSRQPSVRNWLLTHPFFKVMSILKKHTISNGAFSGSTFENGHLVDLYVNGEMIAQGSVVSSAFNKKMKRKEPCFTTQQLELVGLKVEPKGKAKSGCHLLSEIAPWWSGITTSPIFIWTWIFPKLLWSTSHVVTSTQRSGTRVWRLCSSSTIRITTTTSMTAWKTAIISTVIWKSGWT